MSEQDVELKACPFCAGVDLQRWRPELPNGGFVSCRNEECAGNGVMAHKTQWNRRAQSPASGEREATIEECAKVCERSAEAHDRAARQLTGMEMHAANFEAQGARQCAFQLRALAPRPAQAAPEASDQVETVWKEDGLHIVTADGTTHDFLSWSALESKKPSAPISTDEGERHCGNCGRAWTKCARPTQAVEIPSVDEIAEAFHSAVGTQHDAFTHIRNLILAKRAGPAPLAGKAEDERKYPCRECGALRTKAEGGTTFTVCDECWDKAHASPLAGKAGETEAKS